MMHRWPNIRAYMGPEFLALLNWYTMQRSVLESEAENAAAWRGTDASIDRLINNGETI